MNNIDFQAFAKEYNFIEVAEIFYNKNNNNRFSFSYKAVDNKQGFVYLWVEVLKQIYTVVYVGKAGKTLKSRCDQHLNGFHGGSIAGKDNARLLRLGINNGNRYFLYARKSPMISICGEDDIPSECVEELAFIKKLKSSLWNRAGVF